MINSIDDEVEKEIERCLDLDTPKSFFYLQVQVQVKLAL